MLSSPLDLNDPFEFLPNLTHVPHPRERDREAERLQRIAARNTFVASLTEKAHSPRLWSHYGEDHRGIMLTFDSGGLTKSLDAVPAWIRPVRYDLPHRIVVPPPDQKTPVSNSAPFTELLFTTKGQDWEPEAEWRIILPRTNCEPSAVGGIRRPRIQWINHREKAFLPFDAAAITQVTIGYRADPRLIGELANVRSETDACWEIARTQLSAAGFTFESEIT